MKIINLTPHELNIYDDKALVMAIPPSGRIARIGIEKDLIDTINGIPVFQSKAGEPEGLPDQAENTIFVVSGIFRSVCPRQDLYQPGELLRNESGQPIGCIGLSQ